MDWISMEAWAQSAEGASPMGPGGAMANFFIPMILIFAVFYFLLLRPQQVRQKKQKLLLEGLKKGDKVVTSSGILGTVANLSKVTVTLQVADNVKIKMLRDSVTNLREEKED